MRGAKGRARKSRGSLTSQILITRDHPRILVRVTRPRANTRVRTASFTPGFTSVKIALQRELGEKILVNWSEKEN